MYFNESINLSFKHFKHNNIFKRISDDSIRSSISSDYCRVDPKSNYHLYLYLESSFEINMTVRIEILLDLVRILAASSSQLTKLHIGITIEQTEPIHLLLIRDL